MNKPEQLAEEFLKEQNIYVETYWACLDLNHNVRTVDIKKLLGDFKAATPLSAGEEITVKDFEEAINNAVENDGFFASVVSQAAKDCFALAQQMAQQGAGFTVEDMRKCFEAARENEQYNPSDKATVDFTVPKFKTFDDYLKIQSEKK